MGKVNVLKVLLKVKLGHSEFHPRNEQCYSTTITLMVDICMGIICGMFGTLVYSCG